MENGRRVLVVDEFTETADVLRAVLEPRGVCVDESTRTGAVPQCPPARLPSVVVLDEETATARGVDGRDWVGVPRVIIGTIRLPRSGDENSAPLDGSKERFLRKPFQYADLVQAIENLIAESAE